MTPTSAQNPCLAELMDARGMRDSIDLLPHLADRGVLLTEPQVRRLVARRPMLMSLTTLIALCDIFGCSPADIAPSDVPRAEYRNRLPQNETVVDINTVLDTRRAP
ncbi:helix-turn-helix transcriptional regulator [Rhodococcus sp. NKCM2511]|uniref:helix-turn-helix domain-containing protein n=1 Tax=Rhodococcus sp. NKCM2511 TaxID=2766011 RepID=UPI0019105CD6|nr:helix-turn-helix transcriptional regulator [Rhodococcus sp. NKCM2511]